MSIHRTELTGGGAKYIKVGNDSFLAIDGINISEKMMLSDLRINYSDIYKSKFKINKESSVQIDYTQSAVVFMIIKITYKLFKLEEEQFITWKYINKQTSLTVTNNGIGNYIINGKSNLELTLVKGQTYIFNITAIGHPFWIKTSQSIDSIDRYDNGVTNNGTENGTITFEVPIDSPAILYYNCEYHSSMAGIINIVESIEESSTNNLGKLMVLTGNSTNPVGVIELENVNAKYDVDVEVVLATDSNGTNITNTTCKNCYD